MKLKKILSILIISITLTACTSSNGGLNIKDQERVTISKDENTLKG